jgi:hypothetical protein
MKRRNLSFAAGLALAVSLVALLVPLAASARKPAPPPPPPTTNPPSTFVRNYANIVSGSEKALTPEDVQATSDGGTITLGGSQSSNGVGVSWLLKRDANGVPQWQEEVGCLNGAPGDYADGLGVRQTSDGGYVIGGGTIGCGSGNDCPELTGIQCAFVDKFDATGKLTWSRVYKAGVGGSSLNDVQPTSDGGYVAVGSSSDSNDVASPLVLKLDSNGSVQWQRVLSSKSAQGQLDSVVQASDGSYAASGELLDNSSTSQSAVVVKLGSSGSLVWQRGYNVSGSSTAVNNADSIVQTTDGGFAVAGSWSTVTSPGTCCRGPLLLKLDSSGTLQLQKAYAGPVHCVFDGFSERCTALGGFAYQVRQTADGGYLLGGDADFVDRDGSSPLEPWLGKLDASGNVAWQNNYYQMSPTTGRPLSEYFAGVAITTGGQYSAAGFTENPTSGVGELLGVQTDTSGAVGTCAQVHPATQLAAKDPGLASVSPGLSVATAVGSSSNSPAGTLATTGNTFSSSQC